MNYDQLLERLYSVNLHGGIKLGLNNCLALNKALGNPVQQFPAIHVAGTNGKGSVVTKIAAALQATGKRVGLYTSPHISCFRERIKINGTMIPENAIHKHLLHIFSLTEKLQIPATFFEITTMAAFAYFAEEKIDAAVIETGLGGRLDATNIVHSILTIITSISYDHTEILGSTLEEIAFEKAGIIKPGVPVIIGPCVPIKCVQEIANLKNSSLIGVEGFFNHFQEENKAIAAAALQYLNVPEYAIQQGLEATPPCRIETWLPEKLKEIFPEIPLLPKAVILDVAHNPDGIEHLISVLRQRYPASSVRFVLGLSKNKDIASCLNLISKAGSHIHLVEAKSGRAASATLLFGELLKQGCLPSLLTCAPTIQSALHHAIIAAGKQPNEIVAVCGTFFIMSSARAALGIVEPQDFLSFN